MRQRVLGFLVIFGIASVGTAFGQAAPAGQPQGQGQGQGRGGQRGQGDGFTFTTNGNGGLVDAPGQRGQGQQGQRGGRGPAAPARPAPRDANGRALLSQPPGQPGLWIGGITNLTNADGSQIKMP